jgi:hypothetical protein
MEPCIVLVVFTFDGNIIFIPIDVKPKKLKKYTKKIPIVIASLLAVGCGIQIIRFKILLKIMKLLNIIHVTRNVS